MYRDRRDTSFGIRRWHLASEAEAEAFEEFEWWGHENLASADSPSEPNYLGLGLYRPVLELNDPVRELYYPVRELNDPVRDLIDPAPELNYLDLELELFQREPEESSISKRGLKLCV